MENVHAYGSYFTYFLCRRQINFVAFVVVFKVFDALNVIIIQQLYSYTAVQWGQAWSGTVSSLHTSGDVKSANFTKYQFVNAHFKQYKHTQTNINVCCAVWIDKQNFIIKQNSFELHFVSFWAFINWNVKNKVDAQKLIST